jgi:hypothetical protein
MGGDAFVRRASDFGSNYFEGVAVAEKCQLSSLRRHGCGTSHGHGASGALAPLTTGANQRRASDSTLQNEKTLTPLSQSSKGLALADDDYYAV